MRLLTIQYLRGLAALSIVAYHSFVQLGRLGYSPHAPDVLSAGVDLFFVISGFVMWYTTFDRRMSPLTFIKHRLRRIVPLYWVITTVYVSILLISPGLMQSGRFQLAHVIASYAFIPFPHPAVPSQMWPLVVPGWTLNCEMMFYLLFALSLLLPVGQRVWATGLMLCGLVSVQFFQPAPTSFLNFYAQNIMLEFGFGLLLGSLYSKDLRLGLIPCTILAAIALAALTVTFEFGNLGLPRVVIYGLPSLLLVSAAVFAEKSFAIPELRAPEVLGDASYSLYLSHGATLSAFAQLWRQAGGAELSNGFLAILFSASASVCAISLALCLYFMVERPLGNLLTRGKRKAAARIPAPFYSRYPDPSG